MTQAEWLIPALLRVIEAARIAGIGKSLAYEYVNDGTWPSVRLNGGKQIRIPRKGLEAWIASMEEKANLASYLEEISSENC